MRHFFAYLRYAAAEMDCMTALTLDPLYVKAYLRLGSAQFLMKKLQKAKETFEKVLQLEPQNKQAKLEIEKIEKVCRLCWLEMFYNQMLSLHGGSCLYEAIHVSLSHIYFNSQMLYFVVHTYDVHMNWFRNQLHANAFFAWCFMPVWRCAYFIVSKMISKWNDF